MGDGGRGYSSEIGRKDKLKAASERLQLLNVKQLPSALDTTRIQPVFEIDPQPVAPAIGPETVDYSGGNIVSLAGVGSVDLEILPAPPANLNTRVNAISFRIDVPSDPAPTEVQLFMYYQLPVGQPFRIIDFKPAFSTATGALTQYRYALGGSFVVVSGTSSGWHGHVTPLVPLRVSVVRSAGGTFPAASQLIWDRFVSQWPVGTLAPWS